MTASPLKFRVSKAGVFWYGFALATLCTLSLFAFQYQLMDGALTPQQQREAFVQAALRVISALIILVALASCGIAYWYMVVFVPRQDAKIDSKRKQ